jgi:hypothetical protein
VQRRARILRPLRHAWASLRPSLRRETVARLALAFVLAFGLWAWVEATNDPETQRTISNVPVLPRGLSPQLVVTSELPTVTVRIQGAQSRVQSFESGAIQAWIDLRDVDSPGTYIRPVRVQLPSRLRLREVVPQEVTVQIDRLVERGDVPVEVIFTGQMPPNLQVLSTTLDPATVIVRGPQQRVENIARVTAPLQLAGRTESFQESVTLIPVDANGVTVPGITVEPSTAVVSVQLRVRGQVRRVVPTIVGADKLAPGTNSLVLRQCFPLTRSSSKAPSQHSLPFHISRPRRSMCQDGASLVSCGTFLSIHRGFLRGLQWIRRRSTSPSRFGELRKPDHFKVSRSLW